MESLRQEISAAAKGNMQAFNRLYEYSYSTVEKECLRVLHNSIDAEDAVQESYLRIYKRLGSLKDPDKFLSWCRTIAHNEAVSYIRGRKADKDDLKPPVSDEQYSGMDSVDDESQVVNPEDQAEQQMVHDLLQQALDDIPPQRAMCLAQHQQGYNYQEIASQLSIPLGTVKSNIFYAKQAMREAIQKVEKQENVQIFGFTLVPVGGKVQIKMEPPKGSGFIQADVWDSVAQNISTTSAARGSMWKKIAAIAAAVLIIAGGIIFAVNRAGKANLEKRPETSSISQGERQESGTAVSQRAALARRANAASGGNTGRSALRTVQNGAGAPAATAARPSRVEQPVTAAPTTAEVYTNEGRNFRNAF